MKIKRSVTLIEMVIALALVLILGSILALPAARFIQETRFDREAKRIADKFNLASQLSVTLSTKVKVFMEKEGGVWKIYLSHNLENNHDPLLQLFKKKEALPALSAVHFEKEEKNEYRFTFYAGGKVPMEGVLELASAPLIGKKVWIHFPGYLAPFHVETSLPKKKPASTPPHYPQEFIRVIEL